MDYSMTLDKTSTSPLRGGSITVDGITIQIPENLMPTLPAVAVAWAELFDASGNTGAAIGFEANVSCAHILNGGND
jgi:hypothetical protein